MLYADYILKVMKAVIVDDEDASGYSYLEPNYRVLLIDAELTPDIVTDYEVTWHMLSEALKLEVERRNRLTDKGRFVMDWLFSIITTTIEPTMIAEENELMKNTMEYMKLNHELKEKEQDLQKREDIQDKKDNIFELMPGMNFSKRGAK